MSDQANESKPEFCHVVWGEESADWKVHDPRDGTEVTFGALLQDVSRYWGMQHEDMCFTDADGAASACGGTPDDADGDALDEAELAREVDLYAAEHLRDTEPETVALRREEFEAQLRVILSVPKAELRRTLPMIERCARLARERLGESA